VIADRVVTQTGRGIALMGVVLPLLLIGFSKFAAFEVEALKPLVSGPGWRGCTPCSGLSTRLD
jgi:uncharacterized membrane protein YkgB